MVYRKKILLAITELFGGELSATDFQKLLFMFSERQIEKRKNLNSQSDYDNLFLEYKQSVIPNRSQTIKFISDLINNYGRVALTRFEALPKQCHRTSVANAVTNIDEKIPLKHI